MGKYFDYLDSVAFSRVRLRVPMDGRIGVASINLQSKSCEGSARSDPLPSQASSGKKVARHGSSTEQTQTCWGTVWGEWRDGGWEWRRREREKAERWRRVRLIFRSQANFETFGVSARYGISVLGALGSRQHGGGPDRLRMGADVMSRAHFALLGCLYCAAVPRDRDGRSNGTTSGTTLARTRFDTTDLILPLLLVAAGVEALAAASTEIFVETRIYSAGGFRCWLPPMKSPIGPSSRRV